MNSQAEQNKLLHPRTIGWFGTTAVAMGGINQSLFIISALFVGQGDIPGQGSAAVPLLIAGVLLSWAAISPFSKSQSLPFTRAASPFRQPLYAKNWTRSAHLSAHPPSPSLIVFTNSRNWV